MRLLGKALTFDDVLLVPAYSQVLPKDTQLSTQFSRHIALNLPLVSAAMDTVTEARLAIAIAQEGGMGIVHKNLTAEQQASEVAKVKRYESGVLLDPVVITPDHTVRQVMVMSEQMGISGFPVCDGGKVVGIVSGRDLRFETRYEVKVKEIMTPRERLITVPEGTTPEQAKALLNKHKASSLSKTSPSKPVSPMPLGTLQDACGLALRWVWALVPRNVWQRWSKQVWTPSWSIQRMDTATG
jgi:IMP dehydrogenase